MINNKAELTTQQIVTIIILIASFAILLLFYFNLNLGETSKKDICHDSVIKQSNFASAFQSGSIDCRTEYVCISGGEDCENFGADTTIEIDAKNESEFYRAIAEEMADCWWMFGEGKIDYSGAKWLGSGSYCSICSVLAFDENVINMEINYEDFLKYLRENKMQGSSETYLNYLTSFGEKYGELYSEKVIDLNKEMVILTAINDDGPFVFKRKPEDVSFAIPPMFLIKDKTTYNNDPFNCKNFVTMA